MVLSLLLLVLCWLHLAGLLAFASARGGLALPT